MRTKIFNSLKSNLITGILVLTPIGAVFWIILWLWNFLFVLSDLVPDVYRPTVFFAIESRILSSLMEFLLTIVILALLILFIWAVGFFSRYYIAKMIFEAISGFVNHLPVVRSVYSTLKQLLNTFASGQSKSFRRVVWVQYPHPGIFTLGFVTGERELEMESGKKEKVLNLYVPTTPNPTSGFYLMAPERSVRPAQISVEEALKEILSLGLVQK